MQRPRLARVQGSDRRRRRPIIGTRHLKATRVTEAHKGPAADKHDEQAETKLPPNPIAMFIEATRFRLSDLAARSHRRVVTHGRDNEPRGGAEGQEVLAGLQPWAFGSLLAGLGWTGSLVSLAGFSSWMPNCIPKCDRALTARPCASRWGSSPVTITGSTLYRFAGKGINLFDLEPYIDAIDPGRYALVILDVGGCSSPWHFRERQRAGDAALQQDRRLHFYLARGWVNVHHASKGDQSGKSATDVGSGAGSQSRAADTHLIIRPHQEENVAVVEAVVRSWPPVDRFCVRWEYPAWQLDPEADPRRLWVAPSARERAKKTRDAHLEEDRQTIVDAMLKIAEPQTMTFIRDLSVGNPRFGIAWASLISDKTIVSAGIIRKGQQPALRRFHSRTGENEPMTQRDSNGITQRDKTCPVAVASGRERPRKGLLLPIRPDAKNTVKRITSGYASSKAEPERFHLVLQVLPDQGGLAALRLREHAKVSLAGLSAEVRRMPRTCPPDAAGRMWTPPAATGNER